MTRVQPTPGAGTRNRPAPEGASRFDSLIAGSAQGDQKESIAAFSVAEGRMTAVAFAASGR